MWSQTKIHPINFYKICAARDFLADDKHQSKHLKTFTEYKNYFLFFWVFFHQNIGWRNANNMSVYILGIEWTKQNHGLIYFKQIWAGI